MLLFSALLIVFGYIANRGESYELVDIFNRVLALLCNVTWSFFCLNFIRKDSTIAEQENRFESVLEAAPLGTYITKENGRIVYANAEMEKVFGYSKSQLLEMNVDDVIPGSLKIIREKHSDASCTSSKYVVYNSKKRLSGLRRDGSKFPITLALTPITFQGEALAISTVSDITSQVKYEKDLKALNAKFKSRNDELEQFVYIVSHDLRSPLVTISAQAKRLEREPSVTESPTAKIRLEKIEKNVNIMDTLLTDLLDFSRASIKELSLATFCVREAIDKALEINREQVNRLNAEVKKPSRCSSFCIEGQESLYIQVFTNLISNAIKYRHTEKKLELVIAIEETLDTLELKFSDNGRGIPLDQHEKVFRIFERFHPDVKEGSGVGLAIVHKNINRHGGRICFSSTPGEGVSFFLTLPKKVASWKISNRICIK